MPVATNRAAAFGVKTWDQMQECEQRTTGEPKKHTPTAARSRSPDVK